MFAHLLIAAAMVAAASSAGFDTGAIGESLVDRVEAHVRTARRAARQLALLDLPSARAASCRIYSRRMTLCRTRQSCCLGSRRG